MKSPERCLCGALDCRECRPYGYWERCSCEDGYGVVVVEGYCPECDETHMECAECPGDELIDSAEECADGVWRCRPHEERFNKFDAPRFLLAVWLERMRASVDGR